MRQINSLLCRSFGYYCSALLLILSVDYAVAKSLVCLNPSIQGYENTIKSAKALLGSYNTTNKDEIRLFIKKMEISYFFSQISARQAVARCRQQKF